MQRGSGFESQVEQKIVRYCAFLLKNFQYQPGIRNLAVLTTVPRNARKAVSYYLILMIIVLLSKEESRAPDHAKDRRTNKVCSGYPPSRECKKGCQRGVATDSQVPQNLSDDHDRSDKSELKS
ncbi:jg4804 [Pararge aegeria aegeria]|uniref:Jg4804 protein n=1 Tax=Pararge aegeria aegeria TaxID=348720 RepID=A0A8S4R167_9NEOP|nr:jg4804 [Pararge aegeria aegeria]